MGPDGLESLAALSDGAPSTDGDGDNQILEEFLLAYPNWLAVSQ